MSVLLGVVAASFITLGVIIYFFGDDQSIAMSAANNPPAQTERMIRSNARQPTTVPGTSGQTSQPVAVSFADAASPRTTGAGVLHCDAIAAARAIERAAIDTSIAACLDITEHPR